MLSCKYAINCMHHYGLLMSLMINDRLTPEKLHSMNMNIYAGLAISGASIVAKELLFRYTL